MRLPGFLSVASICALLAGACQMSASSQRAADSVAVHAAIEDIIAKSVAMDNGGPVEPSVATYTEDAVRYTSAPPLHGRSAIRASMTAPSPAVEMESHEAIESLRVSGDLAVASGTWAVKGRLKVDSTLASVQGHWLIALRREPDGVWRMSHDMVTEEPATNPAPR